VPEVAPSRPRVLAVDDDPTVRAFVRALLVDVHLVVIAEGEAKTIGEDVAGSAYIGGQIHFITPGCAAICGRAKVDIPFVHSAVGCAGIHPGDADVSISSCRDGREGVVIALRCSGDILFGSPGVTAVGGLREINSLRASGRGPCIPKGIQIPRGVRCHCHLGTQVGPAAREG